MTAPSRDDDRTLVAWLVDGVDVAPPRVVRSALEQAMTTRQRRELALVRRAYNMEATGPLNRNRELRIGLVGMAGVLVVVALAVVANFLPRAQNSPAASVPPIASALPTATAVPTKATASPATASPPTPSENPARATILLDGVEAPSGTSETARFEGRAALAALATRSSVLVFSQDRMGESPGGAAAILYDAADTGDQRAYTVAALTFTNAGAASSALASIRTGFSAATGMWAGGNSPLADEHLPAGRDEGFDRSGTWWAFGGTSANASSRVGHMNIWRVGEVVFVAFGVDWMTPGTWEYQSTIEAGVVSLSEYLTAQAR